MASRFVIRKNLYFILDGDDIGKAAEDNVAYEVAPQGAAGILCFSNEELTVARNERHVMLLIGGTAFIVPMSCLKAVES